MPFNPNAADSFQRELIPEGAHAARCARIIELGKQESQYGVAEKAVIALSIPSVTVNIGGEEKQALISNPYGITMSNSDRSTMKQYAKALNPAAQNLGDFLDKTCQVYVKHVDKGERVIQKIDSVSALLAGIEVPPLDTPPFWFQWEDPDPEVWVLIPEFQQEMITKAVNYPGSYVEEMVLGVSGVTQDDNDLPM